MRYLERPQRGDGVTVSQIDEFVATADSTGTAEFTAVPSEALPETAFQSATVGFYEMDYAALKSSAPLTEVTVIVRRIPVLRVQVTYPDGRPALGARVLYRRGNTVRNGRMHRSAIICITPPGETVVHCVPRRCVLRGERHDRGIYVEAGSPRGPHGRTDATRASRVGAGGARARHPHGGKGSAGRARIEPVDTDRARSRTTMPSCRRTNDCRGHCPRAIANM